MFLSVACPLPSDPDSDDTLAKINKLGKSKLSANFASIDSSRKLIHRREQHHHAKAFKNKQHTLSAPTSLKIFPKASFVDKENDFGGNTETPDV